MAPRRWRTGTNGIGQAGLGHAGGADGADAEHTDVAALQRLGHVVEQVHEAGDLEEVLDGRLGRERERVDPSVDDRPDQTLGVGRVGRQRPAIDGDADDVGTHRFDLVAQILGPCAVELHRDPRATQVTRREEIGDVVVPRPRRGPGDVEPDRDERAGGLRTAGEQFGLAEEGAEIVAQLDRVGGFEPPAHTEPGREDHQVRWIVEQQLRGRPHLVLRPDGMRLDDRAVQAFGTAAGEQLHLFVGAPVGRDADRVALQRSSIHSAEFRGRSFRRGFRCGYVAVDHGRAVTLRPGADRRSSPPRRPR